MKTIPVAGLEKIRLQFPILNQEVHGKPLVYLDNAATTQKPSRVIEAESNYYLHINSNVHRGVHRLSELATAAYEGTRKQLAYFLHAPSPNQIIFTSGTTASINLVASSFGQAFLKPGDEVLISAMEHHSNIVPWQLVCGKMGAKVKVIPMSDDGVLDMEQYKKLLTPKVKIVGLVYVSNSLGTVNPIKEMIALAHAADIPVLVDGAQAVQHMEVNVTELDCDFFAGSGHKMYGPTGTGFLYGKDKWLNEMQPWQGGGDMIKSVSFEKTSFNELPYKFEAGTPNIAGFVALGESLRFLNETGLKKIQSHESGLLEFTQDALKSMNRVRIIGNSPEKAGAISFVLDGIHPHDTGTILDREGIAVRTGHHCTQPVMDRFGIPATTRVSFGVYNTIEDCEKFLAGLEKVFHIFG